MNTVTKLLVAAALGVAAIPAYADNYSVLFTDTFGMGVNGTGTFSYSHGKFYNFDVHWDGVTFDLTADSNAIAGVDGCNTGPGIAAFDFLEGAACAAPATYQWGAAAGFGGGPGATFLFSPYNEGYGKSLDVLAPYASSQGTLTLTDLSTHPAPEIDPNSAVSALALLLGGLIVLRGRRPRGGTA